MAFSLPEATIYILFLRKFTLMWTFCPLECRDNYKRKRRAFMTQNIVSWKASMFIPENHHQLLWANPDPVGQSAVSRVWLFTILWTITPGSSDFGRRVHLEILWVLVEQMMSVTWEASPCFEQGFIWEELKWWENKAGYTTSFTQTHTSAPQEPRWAMWWRRGADGDRALWGSWAPSAGRLTARASVGAVTAHSHLQGALGKDFGGDNMLSTRNCPCESTI